MHWPISIQPPLAINGNNSKFEIRIHERLKWDPQKWSRSKNSTRIIDRSLSAVLHLHSYSHKATLYHWLPRIKKSDPDTPQRNSDSWLILFFKWYPSTSEIPKGLTAAARVPKFGYACEYYESIPSLSFPAQDRTQRTSIINGSLLSFVIISNFIWSQSHNRSHFYGGGHQRSALCSW